MELNLEDIKEIFIAESSDILQKMENTLIEFENNNISEEKINELFRSVHTIKGNAGVFGFEKIVKFTHVAENVLDLARESKLNFDKNLINILLDCRDHISDLVESSATKQPISDEINNHEIELLKKLNSYLGNEEKSVLNAQSIIQKDVITKSDFSNNRWHISLRFKENTFKDGLDPYSVINYLNKSGEILNLKTIFSHIPDFDLLDPENCYLGFEILYHSTKDASFILQAFEFVEFNCDIKIISPNKTREELLDFFNQTKEKKYKLAKLLILMGSLTKNDLRKIKPRKVITDIKIQKSISENFLISNIESTTKSTDIKNLLQKEELIDNKKNPKTKESKIIRVDSAKLDTLINLVGELVIAGANLNQVSFKRKDSELSEISDYLNRLISDIRENSLKIRMVYIGEAFSKFQRTVREIGQELNKEISLKITGAETELDKSIVEKMNDPLIHLIRNAIDHGIESPDLREKKGKSRTGHLELNAYYETGSVVIEVIDDGKGLDKEKILNKAIEKGLIPPDKNLSDDEIYKLIFKAGFSTADKISNISGRGVGLDVVEKSIESLRGSIVLNSENDKGSSFKIKLPLTLAIIDGFLFQIGKHFYIVPLSQVIECIEYSSAYKKHSENKNFINLRNEILPFLSLSHFFKIEENKNVRKNILVVQNGLQKIGLLIETLHGEIQTVIKPLGKVFMNLKGISGSTVLGSGDVALILDIGSLLKKVEEIEKSTNSIK